jgi:hypothetical protein
MSSPALCPWCLEHPVGEPCPHHIPDLALLASPALDTYSELDTCITGKELIAILDEFAKSAQLPINSELVVIRMLTRMRE